MSKNQNSRLRRLLFGGPALAAAIAGVAAGGAAMAEDAQTPPAAAAPVKSTPQIDAGEPRAATSSAAVPVEHAAGAVKPAVTGTGAGTASAARSPAAGGSRAPAAADRLDLGTATVTGDREQPKVMYIVPWKSADVGDLSGKPMNSLLDEALAPVDRDEFRREVAYYDAVKADRPQNGPANPALKQVDK